MNRNLHWLLLLLEAGLAVVLLSACTPAASPVVDTPTPNAAYTAAAETIIAQLTEVSRPKTETPTLPPTDTRPVFVESHLPSETPEITDTPAPTSTPSQTPTPTVTREPTATYAPNDPRLELGEPSWTDTFADGSNWFLFEDDHVTMKVESGRLEMTSLIPGNWDSWMLSYPILADYYLEAVFTTGNCSGGDRYGILLRAPDPNQGYLFGVTCEGQYSFRRWDGTRNHRLIDWTESEAILTGEGATNRLGVRADRRSFALYANAELLAEVTDANYDQGGIGLFVGAGETENFTIHVTEVNYWLLP